jgi:hypothetical protein
VAMTHGNAFVQLIYTNKNVKKEALSNDASEV